MRFVRPLGLVLITSLLALGACADEGDQSAGEETADTSEPKEVRIVKGEHGPDFPEAKLTVLSPAPDQVVGADSAMVRVELTGVELNAPTAGEQSKGIAYSMEGQHIHVIIDDKPYMAMYVSDSFWVKGLSEGSHTLRAFPSRSWHESIKKPGAFVAHTFHVKKKGTDTLIQPGAPLLTYSRPKGEYKGNDAKRILLDFFVANAELGPGKYRVIASIDGQVKDTLDEWIPYFIEGLPDGEHKIGLQLIDPSGAVVPGRFNTAEHTITVARTPPAAGGPGGAGKDTMAGMGH